MAVKIRLQRKGKKKQPFYHIVIADSRSPRDGRFIEKIGSYNPLTKPATIDLDRDKAYDWLTKGAQPTETVRAMLRFKGVLLQKHLMRGVKKGAFNEEVAMEKLGAWIEEKEVKTAARVEKVKAEKDALRAKIAGTGYEPKKIVPKVVAVAAAPVVEEVVEAAPDEVIEAAPEVVEEAPAVVAEEAPTAEVLEQEED